MTAAILENAGIDTSPRPEFKTSLADARKLWTDALRSGKYAQTTHALKRNLGGGDFGYCCLGVACEVFIEAEGTELLKLIGPGAHGIDLTWGYEEPESGRLNSSHLPFTVQQWLGINSSVGTMSEVPFQEFCQTQSIEPKPGRTLVSNHALAGMNDATQATFVQIADLIDSNPAGLFVD